MRIFGCGDAHAQLLSYELERFRDSSKLLLLILRRSRTTSRHLRLVPAIVPARFLRHVAEALTLTHTALIYATEIQVNVVNACDVLLRRLSHGFGLRNFTTTRRMHSVRIYLISRPVRNALLLPVDSAYRLMCYPQP